MSTSETLSYAPALSLRDTAIEIAGARLLGPLSVAIARDEAVTLMGPSGCGKSTLLNAICGMLDPVFSIRGDILLEGESILTKPPEARRIGILFQDDLLFPHLSVGENLAFGLPEGLRAAERAERIAAALGEAGLEGFERRDPATLSGGQRARVACLRTLLSEPRLLLLDEPFSKLDAEMKERFRRFVFDHAKMRDLPVLLVTHDIADARSAGGPVVELAV